MYQGNTALSLEPWWEKPAANDELASDRGHYNHFRYYDSRIGRYLTPDPIGQLGGLNLYAYAKNNPLSHIDVNGLTPLEWLFKKGAEQLTKKSAKGRSKDVIDEVLEDNFSEEFQNDIDNGIPKEEAQRRLDEKKRRLDRIKNENIWDQMDRWRQTIKDIENKNNFTNGDGDINSDTNGDTDKDNACKN